VGRNTAGMFVGLPGIPPLVDNTYPSGISIRDNHLAGAENTCISF